MEKTIFLHIGMNKTGTTAIQQTLNKNNKMLCEKGLVYPKTGLSDVSGSHQMLSSWLGFGHDRSQVLDQAALAEKAKELRREIDQSGCREAILSSEFFVLNGNIRKVADFFTPNAVKVVVYLRRHDEWWKSVYSQALKTVANPPWARGFTNYLRYHEVHSPKIGDYLHLLDSWAQVFGPENILVRPYERQQNQPNLMADLLTTIGFGHLASEIDQDRPHANPGISFTAMELLDIFQRVNVDAGKRKKLVKYALSHKGKVGVDALLPPEQRQKLVQRHRATYEEINYKYRNGQPGGLFLENLPETDQNWKPLLHLSAMDAIDHFMIANSDAA